MNFKRNTIFFALLFASLSQSLNAQSIIRGTWNRKHDGFVRLYKIEHGRLEEIGSAKPASDASFGFAFYPDKESYYVIGTGNAGSAVNKYYFYFKKNDALEVEVNDSSYVLKNKNTIENVVLSEWHNLVLPIERKSVYFMNNHSTYEDFFPTLQAVLQKADKWKSKPTGNAKFDQTFARSRQLDLSYFSLELLTTPRSKHPNSDEIPGFYKSISSSKLTTDTRLLDYYAGARILQSFLFTYNNIQEGVPKMLDEEATLKLIVNDTIKGENVLTNYAKLKTFIGYQHAESLYGKYVITNDQKTRAQTIKNKLAVEATKNGQPAINFTYPDVEGKMVSLNDFKGKVVLVDVWATWCGPCKAEIPALKKLENEMHGKDIVIMSVSVDEQKDHQKWKDFIKTENLGGVQLFAAGWSDIAKFYDIKGIPRFMVFDKNGHIVNVNAPRPSSPELKLLLENELKK